MATTAWKSIRPVLMTADPIGGVWTYALELCREFGNSDVKVALATMGRHLAEDEREAVRQLKNVELFEDEYNLEWMRDPWDDLDRAGKWLLHIEARTQPSLIHLNEYCHGALRWKVPCLIVGHSCVLSWFEAVRDAPAGNEWNRYKQTVAVGLLGAGLVTAPSRFMLSALKNQYGPFAAAEPVYNGSRASEFPPSKKEALVLTAGRLWDEAKNISVLRRVAGKISWPIYAAGEPQSPHGNRIPLTGLIELGKLETAALASWYGRASIFVLPARYEPFGFSALEAALAGCALVLGDIPSLREIWTDGAVFVPPNDPDQIAAALAKLIEDSSLRTGAAERARARALTFSPERMAQGYLRLYQRLLAPRGKIIADVLGDTES